MSHPHQLKIPPIAAGDVKAIEILRAWGVGDSLHVALNHRAWSEPGTWGIMLVDVARHVARAYAQSDGLDEEDTLNRIKQLFDAEWSHATDTPSGGLVSN